MKLFAMNILSPRELEVLDLIANEYKMHEIASELFISLNTVSTHRRNTAQCNTL